MVETEITDNGSTPRALPDVVKVSGSPRFSANQLRVLKAETGLALDQLMNDGAAIVQALALLQLRKAGYTVSWDEAGDVEVELGGLENAPDPTSTERATASPRSADSGV